MSDWSNEPWSYEQDCSWTALRDHNRKRLGWTDGINQEANAQRIVTCVNALAGFPDPEADVKALVEALTNIIAFLPDPELCNDAVEREYIQQGVNALARLRREP